MIAFRRLLRTVPLLQRSISTSAPRPSGAWHYRVAPKPSSKRVLITAELVMGGMWWWILWHLFTEPEHITGEFPYPDPTQWTDAELGIPPDDED